MSEPTATPEAPTQEQPSSESQTPLDSLPTIDESSFVDSIEAAFQPEVKIPVEEETPEAEATEETPEAEATEENTEAEDSEKKTSALEDLEEIEETTKDWTPQAARRFKEIKAELKTLKQKNAELEAENVQNKSIAEEQKALAENPEFQEMKTQLEEYENKMIVTRLEESNAYQRAIAEPLNKIITEAQQFAENHNIEPDALLDAMANDNDELLSELLVDVPERQRSRVYNMIEEVGPIAAKREELIQNAEAALAEAEQLDEHQKQTELRQRATQRKEAATQVADTIKSKIPFIETVDDLDLSAISQVGAETDPTLLDPVQGAYQAMSAKILPKLVPYIMSLQQEIGSLTDKLAEFDDAEPKTGGGSSSDSGLKGSTPISEGGFLERVAAQMGG